MPVSQENKEQTTDYAAMKALNTMYQDGVISEAEADRLFAIRAQVPPSDTAWQARFSEAIRDYILHQNQPSNWVSMNEAVWLIAHIEASDDKYRWNMIDLLIDILRKADGADERLSTYLHDKITKSCLEDGVVGSDDVERLRFVFFAGSGAGGSWINEAEVDCLFAIDEATARAQNAPSWNDFFARAVANHVMSKASDLTISEETSLAREAWLQKRRDIAEAAASGLFRHGFKGFLSDVFYNTRRDSLKRRMNEVARANQAEKVTKFEAGMLHERIHADGFVSPAEQALLDFLQAESPDYVPLAD